MTALDQFKKELKKEKAENNKLKIQLDVVENQVNKLTKENAEMR